MDRIASDHDFSPWKARFQGLMSEGRLGTGRVSLLKPQTFMNRSGEAVAEALHFYKLDVDALTAFHDELDLAPMKVKVRIGGGLAGHNGLRSINASLGPDFRRVRIGIGHPGHKDRVTGYVLGNYTKNEMGPLSDLLAALAELQVLPEEPEREDPLLQLHPLRHPALDPRVIPPPGREEALDGPGLGRDEPVQRHRDVESQHVSPPVPSSCVRGPGGRSSPGT